jgi:hypothetical protein
VLLDDRFEKAWEVFREAVSMQSRRVRKVFGPLADEFPLFLRALSDGAIIIAPVFPEGGLHYAFSIRGPYGNVSPIICIPAAALGMDDSNPEQDELMNLELRPERGLLP